MHASNPSASILERCGTRCDWPDDVPASPADARPERLRRAELMLPARSDARTPLRMLLRGRCENAVRLLVQAMRAQAVVVILVRAPVLH